MAFNLEQLKKYASVEKIKEVVEQFKSTAASGGQNKGKVSKYPIIAKFKQELQDLKAVLEEGKYQLFIKQVVALLACFLVVRFVCGKLETKKEALRDQIAAISIQKDNKADYLENKQQLLLLEPLFPDVAEKNEWMLRRLIKFFDDRHISPNIDGNPAESSGGIYTVFTQPVTFTQGFAALGRLVEDVENGDDFLRISEITITKLTGEKLGENTVDMKFNTVFPREKYGPKLFKDYEQQIQKLQARQKKELAQAQQAASPAPTPAPAEEDKE